MSSEGWREEEEIARGLREAHSDLSRARKALAAPTASALERCAPYLRSAIRCLENLGEPGPRRRGHMDLLTTAQDLQREIAQVRLLMEHAMRFYLGWMQIAGAKLGGYTRQGKPATLDLGRRVSVEA